MEFVNRDNHGCPCCVAAAVPIESALRAPMIVNGTHTSEAGSSRRVMAVHPYGSCCSTLRNQSNPNAVEKLYSEVRTTVVVVQQLYKIISNVRTSPTSTFTSHHAPHSYRKSSIARNSGVNTNFLVCYEYYLQHNINMIPSYVVVSSFYLIVHYNSSSTTIESLKHSPTKQ